MQKLPHLFATPFDPRQFFNCAGRLPQTFGRMLAEIGFDLSLVLCQVAGRLIEIQLFESRVGSLTRTI